jgi:hypothetical protein
MTQRILVYWIGIIGIAGKGPAYTETYNPNRTIGELIQAMTSTGLGERKRIEIFKFQPGNLSKYDKSNPYWSHDTKLSDYVIQMGGLNDNDIMLVYVII